jgi:hypothetical protein
MPRAPWHARPSWMATANYSRSRSAPGARPRRGAQKTKPARWTIPAARPARRSRPAPRLAKGNTTKGECVKVESFDAGPLAFGGTTTPITLYPPYKFESTGRGAPFLGGATLKIQAQGTTSAGYEAFEETFTATTFIQTTPGLSKLTRETVFGKGPIPISWAPGKDAVVVTLSGAGGSATCKAQDALGKFDVPRSVVKTVLGEGTAVVSISVARQRKETKRDKKTKGQLAATPIQPVGWLELITVSGESASFQGCSGAESLCGDDCIDLRTEPTHCGSCSNACADGAPCSGGKCGEVTCEVCNQRANTGACKSQLATCNQDVACTNYASCFESCADAACGARCNTTYPMGKTKYDAYVTCVLAACPSCR